MRSTARPGDLEDASSILGGKTWDTARRITIPLALPAVLAGALVAFLQAMTLFGSPAILAMPAGFHTMTTKIWSLFQFPPKPELAAAASLPLLVLTVILLRAEHMVLGRRGYSVVGGKNSEPRIVRLGTGAGSMLAAAHGRADVPGVPALFRAAQRGVLQGRLATGRRSHNFTLQNVHFVFFELSATSARAKNTFILGILAATVGTILALVIAYVTARKAVTGYRVLGFLATAPIAIPGIVLGVGLFFSYTRPPFVLYGTLWILLIAFVTLALPAAYQQLQSAFRSVHPELEDASRILGATRLRSLWQITAPLLRTSVIATWCFIFVGVIRELSAAIMLFTSETKVLSVLIYDLNESGDLAAISVLGLVMLMITFGDRGACQQPARRQCAPQRRGWVNSWPPISPRFPSPNIWPRASPRSTRRSCPPPCARNAKICWSTSPASASPRATRITSRPRSPASTTTGPARRSATPAR